ncbi:MAG: TonB-dependent receptor [Pseudomonadota bacterium]|nr:TonB-dependent receptor [Pseudomonadota bacterium]
MKFCLAPRRAPAATPLALVSALSLCFCAAAVHAQDGVMPSVLITGARFAAAPDLAPIGATVISADQIRRAGVADVNQAIRKIGGVYGRQSLDASPDFALDLRGFGSNSSENMVIMLDGVRMSENELASPTLSTIPIETVERIEIIRGGSAVLYGEGATGGVILIVTKRPAKDSRRGALFAEAGQFNQHDVRASVAQSWDGMALDAAIGNQGTDNYRANSRFRQTAFSGGAQWAVGAGRVGLRLDSARQESRLPGSLTMAQYLANARQTQTPQDFSSLDSDRVTAVVEQRLGAVDLAAELSHREKTVKAHYVSGYGITDLTYDSEQTQFSPRLRHLAQLGGMLNEVIAGVDLIRWKRLTHADFSKADARQESKAIYLRDEIRWDPAHNGRFALGARHEVFDKDYVDPFSFTPKPESTSQAQNAWEAQGSYSVLPALNLHLKAGQSYRMANADENSYRSSITVLKAQTSHDLELGATFGEAGQQVSARAFRHRLVNEIFFDPTLNYGVNTNLDPTERAGVEIDAEGRIGADWRISGHLQHVKASFTAGPNNGREMVLVPKNIVSARLSWVPVDGQSADLGAQWVDSQRYGSDFTNACAARIPSHTTVDGRYARKLGAWEFAVAGLNLADKRYFSNAFGCQAGIYPADGRQLKLSARYDF